MRSSNIDDAPDNTRRFKTKSAFRRPRARFQWESDALTRQRPSRRACAKREASTVSRHRPRSATRRRLAGARSILAYREVRPRRRCPYLNHLAHYQLSLDWRSSAKRVNQPWWRSCRALRERGSMSRSIHGSKQSLSLRSSWPYRSRESDRAN